ncbi:DUF6199 family natural product biosynthesis protein [Paenibacillus sp. GP183]|uniref:DUF6199 family natural product biosynthesis protein n=1 Tax=Paenibacillus sp. GP183 TaxID=1882751 RepID=UPI00089ABE4F|nr:DUF6199 family natural product biosynthesis protein [Paenibacillus sp. GP183]SEB93331.1 hypothetical protein SAMN05443246_2395 [Paenibacillus sp. GP183]
MEFISVLLVLLGWMMLFKPSIIWSITENWKSNDATEPSDLYVKSTRFGGIIVTLAGLSGVLIFWFL